MRDLDKLGLVGIVAALGYAGYIHYRFSKVYDMVEESIDDVTDTTHVNIAPAIIDEAVNRAIERDVKIAIRQATDEANKNIRKDMNLQVKQAVYEEYADVREKVSTEVARQVSNLNMKLLEADVTEKATKLVMDKFQGNLDDLLKDFNDNLKNVSKIYESIADSMKK